MSGNAFKEQNPYPVTYDDWIVIKSMMSDFFPSIEEIGSSQHYFKEGQGMYTVTLGDLDFAIEMSKEKIIEVIQNNPEVFRYHRVFGNTVSTLVFNPEIGEIQHVDLMPTVNAKDEAWIMTGGSENIKGVMRNVLLSFIANKKSEAVSGSTGRKTKWTIAYPGGIGVGYDGKKPMERITDPQVILSQLDLDNNTWDVNITKTFEGLVEYVEWTNDLYSEFTEYSRKQWLYKKNPQVIDKALAFLKSNYIDYL